MPRNLRCLFSTEDLIELSDIEKFFVIQISDKSDSVSVDRLKPVISSIPVIPGVPPVCGQPRLKPASIPGLRVQDPLLVKKVSFSPAVKKVKFFPVPATQLCRNPHCSFQGSLPVSTVLRPHLLGGVTVATTNLTTAFDTVCSLSPPMNHAGRSPQ